MVPEDFWLYAYAGKTARQRLYDVDAKTDNIQTAVSDLQVKGAQRHAAVTAKQADLEAKLDQILALLQES